MWSDSVGNWWTHFDQPQFVGNKTDCAWSNQCCDFNVVITISIIIRHLQLRVASSLARALASALVHLQGLNSKTTQQIVCT